MHSVVILLTRSAHSFVALSSRSPFPSSSSILSPSRSTMAPSRCGDLAPSEYSDSQNSIAAARAPAAAEGDEGDSAGQASSRPRR